MSDLLTSILSGSSSNSASSASSTSSANKSQSDLLVQAYQKTRQPEIDVLNQKKASLEKRQRFFLNLRTKIDSLLSNVDTFTSDNANSKFVTRTVTSSDSTVLTASSDSNAALGINTIKVDRLASSDNLVSNKMTLADATTLTPGVYNFTISGKSGSITLTSDDTTNEKVMQKLVNAINLTTDITVNANYIKVDSTSGKITITSKTTGKDNDIQFTDSSILTAFGITNAALNPHSATRTVLGDTTAGYKEADYSNLDAKLSINGVGILRGTNSISDAITGLTLNILKPQATNDLPVTLQSSVNRAAVDSLIQPILTSYNDLLSFLKSDPAVIRSDSAISNLTSKIRSITSQAVSSVPDGDPKYITEIGIKIGTDGSLSIKDTTLLENLLKQDPQKVANIFTKTDGFTSKLNSAIANLGGTSGLIVARNYSLRSQIEATMKKTQDLQKRIDAQANIMRNEYESMLKVYMNAQNQYNTLGALQQR